MYDLIIVSNRLPIKITKTDDGYEYTKTSGGLASGIDSLSSQKNFIWVGNLSGVDLTEDEESRIKDDLWKKFRYVPLFINERLNHRYYNNFSNQTLWPLLHSFMNDVEYSVEDHRAYKKVNHLFSKAINQLVDEGTKVWVHDYHLFYLPEMLKKDYPLIDVAFFLHIPFPPYDNFSTVNFSKSILKSLSTANSIGFHLPEYSVNFRMALQSFGFTENLPEISSISIGIDPSQFRTLLQSPAMFNRVKEIKKQFKNKKIVIEVDRTDYIKGLPQKYKAIDLFFKKNPSMVNEVVFLQVAIPSRLAVEAYSNYIHEVNALVQEINGKHGEIYTTPVKMTFGTVDFNELCALYAAGDAILIGSLVDGMNLVALEYVACQDINSGVVIMSENVGALHTLQGALLYKPTNLEEASETILTGLSMDMKERRYRHSLNKRGIDNFTTFTWASNNLKFIEKSDEE